MSVGDLWAEALSSFNSIEVTTASSVYKLLLSLILGSIVGYERKRRGQPAGVRTFSLIAMGSTLAMILSIYVPQEYLGLKNGDPGRIAAQVVTGIGFLGAGAIIQMKGSVRGLTTAAGIWMVAAIGMSVGVGMYSVACIATLFVLIILVWLDRIEHKAKLGTDLKTLQIVVDGIVNDTALYTDILESHKVSITRFNIAYDFDKNKTTILFNILIPESVQFLTLISRLREIYPTSALSLSNQTSVL